MDPSNPSLPAPSHAGGRAASRGEASSSSSPPPPQQQQQQGCAIQPVWMWVWQPNPPLPFEFRVPATGPIPPLPPQFGSQQHPYYLPLGPTVWGPTVYLDAMVAQQMSAAPTWPQEPQFVEHPPWYGPLPPQPHFVGHPPQPVPPIYHQDSRVEEIRSELLSSPMTLEQLVTSEDPESLAILVQQLEVGDEEMREMVLDGFKQCAHGIMGNRQGHAVFEALLRSIQVIVDDDRRREELEIIVEAAVTPRLVRRSKQGVTCLRLLITAVAWSPGLSTALVNYFLRDRVMDNVEGNELIAHCFLTMDYEATRALVRDAMDTIDDKLECSSLGRLACLGTCFRYARGEELPLFQDALVERAVPMAMGPNSNRLVQQLLDRGINRNEFRRRLLSRLMQHVVSLSNDLYGRFVLRRCFLSEDKELQPIVLTACADLPQGDIQALVVILPLHKVLQGGNNYPATARRLALKIQALPPHIRDHDKLQQLMKAVTMVLADDNLANLGD